MIIGKGASWFGLFISGITVLALPTSAAVWYVDKDAPPGGDGTSWVTAFNEIQPGIDAAHADGGGEVWVAEGVYDEVRSGSGGSLDLQEAAAIYGGFHGDETEREGRDPNLYPTVIDGSQSWDGNNATVVVRAANNSLIDGVVLDGGESAQIWCSGVANVEIARSTFHGASRRYGSSVYVYMVSQMLVS